MKKNEKTYAFDVFLSFANEDRDFARQLYEHLKQAGLKVWGSFEQLRDRQTSLMWEINKGVVNSQFAVALVSEPYLTKKWTITEASAFFALAELDKPKIIPIWHQITYEEILKIFPLVFADKFAAIESKNRDMTQIANHVLKMVQNMQNLLPNTEATKHLFNKIWYAPKEYGFFAYRNSFVGELRLSERGIAYGGDKKEWFQKKTQNIYIQADTIEEIEHTNMSGDVAKNWVKVTYNRGQTAWFQDKSDYLASAHGIGNLFGGSQNLYGVLRLLYSQSPSI
ncbi:MAG: toll/interleukin-1 receptor domain-containing protein [Chitinophagales bacterium]